MESIRDKGEERGERKTGITENDKAKSVTDFGKE